MKRGCAINLDDVERAFHRIRAHVDQTPLLSCSALSSLCRFELLLKAESLQATGSFKLRGTLNAIMAAIERGDRRGVITISSGNHALAVARAARMAGLPATVVMKQRASRLKRDAVRADGAEVVYQGVDVDNREDVGDTLHDRHDLRWVHPFNDPDLMAGHGTAGLELIDQAEARGCQPAAVLIPVGGGGLLAGVATAVRARWPGVRVIGVEPEGADDAARSLAAGRVIELTAQAATAADAVNHIHLGEDPWSVIRVLADGIVTVAEEEILTATWLLWTRAGLFVEPAGALTVAAALRGDLPVEPGRPVACLVSGSNADPGDLAPLLADARRRELEATPS